MGELPETPIGKGGKVDDTAVVVAEVVEWTQAHNDVWRQVKRKRQWDSMFSCAAPCRTCSSHDAPVSDSDEDTEFRSGPRMRTRSARFVEDEDTDADDGHFESVVDSEDEEEDWRCNIL